MSILTLSREYGSCGDSVARRVADSLEYALVNKKTILKEMSRYGENWENWTRELDERCPSLWEKYDWSFRGFAALMQSMLLQWALKGNVVILGRGANFVLRSLPHVLTVRIVSKMEARVERIMKSEGLSEDQSRRRIEAKDHERKCFIQAIYGKDWADPSAYELLFDTALQPESQIASSLAGLLTERSSRNTEEVRKHLSLTAKAAQVKAGLLIDPKIFVPVLDVTVVGNTLVLEGIIHNPREKMQVEHAARELAGEIPMDSRLRYRF